MSILPGIIPDELLNLGRIMEESGGAEIGWRKNDAIAVVKSVESADIIVLGGDVYRSSNHGFEVTYDNWYSKRREGEPLREFARRSRTETINYIQAYPELPGKTYLYILVLSDLASHIVLSSYPNDL